MRKNLEKKINALNEENSLRDSFNITQQLNIIPDHAGLVYATNNIMSGDHTQTN